MTKAFAEAGAARIVLVARSQGPLLQAKKDVEALCPQTKIEPHACSIADFKLVNSMMDGVGFVDILVLNAGVSNKAVPILELDPAELENVFGVNVFGPLNLIRASMKQTGRDERSRRTIIYTSAYGVNFVNPGVGGYNASKAVSRFFDFFWSSIAIQVWRPTKQAMTYLMRCIADENPDSSVRTVSFHPCVAYTSMARDSLGLGPDDMKFDTGEYVVFERKRPNLKSML